MKTIQLKTAELQPQWWVVDATDQVVGRLAAAIARILMGKHRPDYTPHMPCGDFIIVINSAKVQFTGNKWTQKTYSRYTGYQSGLITVSADKLHAYRPEIILKLAVRRMLPKTKLGYKMLSRLKIYSGPSHDHQAQQPQTLDLKLK